MKKILLLALSVSAASAAMAQKATIAPFDNTLNGALVKPFKPDSTWRIAPPAVPAGKLFKQKDIDIKKIASNKQFENQLLFNDPPSVYQMPATKLPGNSKMPVIKLDGKSKMPIVGKEPQTKNSRDSVVVTP
ncbi:MAG: hypothetical protein JKY70_03255 [Mucilaginibacter sp.]|nr:hypothetical protein [Mucilaginibacter sp.]